MRVLVITPWVPYPPTGACQQDRFQGLKIMKSLGWEVEVIAHYHDFQDRPAIEAAFAEEGIPLTLVPYTKQKIQLLLRRLPRVLRTPSLLDGPALECTHPAYEQQVTQVTERFQPDVIWLEYTHHWPLLRLLKKYNVATIMKSSLNEPRNCRDENGHSFMSILKSLPKYGGETIAATESDFILAITPDEEDWYRSRGAVQADVLPLRGLAKCFTERHHEQKSVLDVVFLSSNYNMGHNRDALYFLLHEVLPRLREAAPGEFKFHLTGRKFREADRQYLADDVQTTGFIDDLGAFLETMDIAFSPWISGQGMQQKVFEPLCRSLPLLTHKTAGYPFVPNEEVLIGKTPDDFVKHLLTLRDANVRNRISQAAYKKAQSLFSEAAAAEKMQSAVESALG